MCRSTRSSQLTTYSPPLEPGIAAAVIALNAAGIETFTSCEGGPGHAFPEPTVRFYTDGAFDLDALREAKLDVRELRKVWGFVDGVACPESPFWELVFYD